MGTGFKGMHPASTFVFFVFTFVFSMLTSHPLLLGISFFCGFIYDVKLRGKRVVSYFFTALLPLSVLIALFNFLFSHYGVTVLFEIRGIDFTLESLIYGLIFSVKTTATLLWLDCFNEIVTGDKIIYLFGRVSPKLALVISMVLRFIPLIRAQSEDIANAERGIGIATESGKLRGRLRSTARRLSVLVSWTLERGIDTSDSMSARGYGLRGRTSYNSYVFSVRDAAVLILSVFATIAGMFVNSSLTALYNPKTEIGLPDAFSLVLMLFLAFIMLLPIITDLREERKWSISKLKS